MSWVAPSRRAWVGALGLACLLSSVGCGGFEPSAPLPRPRPPAELLRVDGRRLIDGYGTEHRLHGVGFTNEVYTGTRVPLLHHGEEDYARLAEAGFDSVRFYLSYLTFEEDTRPGRYSEEGFSWLDRNVAWARAHGLRLVLNLHVPPGGFQELGRGARLWDDAPTAERFVALWQTIAARYTFEPTVAGYSLLHAPSPTREREQWRQLAQRTIDAIREVDPFHVIFVERVASVRGDASEDASANFVRVRDDNVVYEFPFYEPLAFTQQGAPWAPRATGEARYPRVPELPSLRATSDGATSDGDDADGDDADGDDADGDDALRTRATGEPASRAPDDPAGEPWDRAALEARLERYEAWAEAEGVPLYLCEFGAVAAAFEEERGGLAWVRDVLGFARSHGVGFSFHAYHEAYFGLYRGRGLPRPGTENVELLRLFTEEPAE